MNIHNTFENSTNAASAAVPPAKTPKLCINSERAQ